MESTRLNKISRLIQKELSVIFQKTTKSNFVGSLTSVTTVRTSADLSYARVYLSIFPDSKKEEIFKYIKKNNKFFRHQLGQQIRNQVRKIPELSFFIDDSLDLSERIEDLINE